MLQYYYTFKDNDNQEFKVEIWNNAYSGITEEIIGDANPFTVTYPTISTKFDAVRGSGCDLNIVSTEPMKFIDLYTLDKMNTKIKLYQNIDLLWIGYLDSELYQENTFNEYDIYTINLTGGDGLALLERLYFLDNEGNKYKEIDSLWNIIKKILQKLDLEWNNIYVGLSTTNDETSETTPNILEKTYINQANFYDEDDQPQTCKEVLNNILTPFAAYIQIINANVYITDINTILGVIPPTTTTTTTLKTNYFAYLDNGMTPEGYEYQYRIYSNSEEIYGYNAIPFLKISSDFTEVQSVYIYQNQSVNTGKLHPYELPAVFQSSLSARTLIFDFDIQVVIDDKFHQMWPLDDHSDALELRFDVYNQANTHKQSIHATVATGSYINPFGEYAGTRHLFGQNTITIDAGDRVIYNILQKYDNGKAYILSSNLTITQNE